MFENQRPNPSKVYPEAVKGFGEGAIVEKKTAKKPIVLLIISFLLLTTLIIAFMLSNRSSEDISNSSDHYDEQVAGVATDSTKKKTNSTEAYNQLRFPNTTDIGSRPFITGDDEVDEYIQNIAQKRGYVLRSVPRLPIVKTNSTSSSDEDLLQPLAYEDWLGLKEDAKKNGLNLVLNSGYRSVEWQRSYFVSNLKQKNVNFDLVANGSQDALLNQVMDVVAPPGYSRHHNGYTFDLACDSNNSFDFEDSPCYGWISKDDFAVAKKHHFLPSYPEGADNQGPKPEPWEFVWADL